MQKKFWNSWREKMFLRLAKNSINLNFHYLTYDRSIRKYISAQGRSRKLRFMSWKSKYLKSKISCLRASLSFKRNRNERNDLKSHFIPKTSSKTKRELSNYTEWLSQFEKKSAIRDSRRLIFLSSSSCYISHFYSAWMKWNSSDLTLWNAKISAERKNLWSMQMTSS